MKTKTFIVEKQINFNIKVETEREYFDPISVEKHDKYIIGLHSNKNFEEEIIRNILDGNFDSDSYFKCNMEVKTIKVYIDGYLKSLYTNIFSIDDIKNELEDMRKIIYSNRL